MTKIYTPTDLIRYFYNETSADENIEIMTQLQIDSDLNHEFENLRKALLEIKEIDLNPDPTSVSIIMEYSQSLHEQATH